MTVAAENVLGGLLIDLAAYWRVADIVSAADFEPEHRALFARIAKAANDGDEFDAVTAEDEGFVGAIDLAALTAGTSRIEEYARRVAGTSETSRIRDAGRRISLANNYGEAQEILSAVRPEQAAQVKTVEDGLGEFVETLQARYQSGGMVTGVPTGADSLDELTGGWQPGNLIVLVGETSMGKSALALQMALAAAKYGKEIGKHALYFTLEMTAGELTERAVAHLADFPMKWVTQPATSPENGMDYVTRGSRMLTELPILFDDRCGLTLEQVVSRSTQVHMHKPLCAVFVDYMHIMGRPRRNDVAELGAIATGLKNLSKNLGVPVIALHQLNRGMNLRDERRPTLGDIRASGEIAETANTVIGIYRSEIARPDFAPLAGYAEALILKQRQGRRDVRAWMRSRIGNMRLESCEAPEGYDETITKDKPAGGAGSTSQDGAIQTRRTARAQPSRLSVVDRDG